MKLLLVLGALVALTFAAVSAAPKVPSGTIAIGAGSDLSLGGEVAFETTHDGFKGYQYPMVYVACYQDVNEDGVIDTAFGSVEDIVYGQLDYPETAFVLGGGSSLWLNQRGGPAECIAYLMVYGDKDDGGAQYVLDSVSFSAGG